MQHQQTPSPTEISQKFFGGEPIQWTVTGMALNSDQGSVVGRVGGALASISGTQRYTVQYHFRPMFAAGDYFGKGKTNWYPDLQISGMIATDSQDWRYPDITFMKLMDNILGALSGIF